VDFNLKKDRVKVAVSDEARYKSRAGDPLSRQEGCASLLLKTISAKCTMPGCENPGKIGPLQTTSFPVT
jgi:hypothetical protein